MAGLLPKAQLFPLQSFTTCASGQEPWSCSGFRIALWGARHNFKGKLYQQALRLSPWHSVLLSFMTSLKDRTSWLYSCWLGTILSCNFITHIHYLIRNLCTISSYSHCILKFQGSKKTFHIDSLFFQWFDCFFLKKSVLIILNFIHSNIALFIFLRLHSFFIISAISPIIINISDALQYGISYWVYIMIQILFKMMIFCHKKKDWMGPFTWTYMETTVTFWKPKIVSNFLIKKKE